MFVLLTTNGNKSFLRETWYHVRDTNMLLGLCEGLQTLRHTFLPI